MSLARQMTAPTPTVSERLVHAGGLKWRIAEAGKGPDILLVHGTASSLHSWRDVMPFLAANHHVVAMDLPGHGDTGMRTSRDLSLDGMAAAVAALCETLGLSPVAAAGHSAGAAILVRMCATGSLSPKTLVSFNGAFYPFGGAAGSLFSPIAKLLAFNPFLPRAVSGLTSRSGVERLLRDTGSSLSEAGIDHYFRLLKKPDHVAAALGMMAAWNLRAIENDLAKIKADCVFVTGKRDRSVPPETSDRAAKNCRHSRVLHIDGFGHLLHEENPELAAAIIAGIKP
jgi:magnesium chelatase accessory protein